MVEDSLEGQSDGSKRVVEVAREGQRGGLPKKGDNNGMVRAGAVAE